MSTSPDAELARVVRDHAGRLAASLVHLVGDFSRAEDLVQEAIEAALRTWPEDGVPERPDAWLYTVARRRGLDLLRREERHRQLLARAVWPAESSPDDPLRLIFTCCHPALPRAAQVALTLRVVCGLTTAQVAKALVVRESAVARRITRAKQKISDAGIPYRVPDPDELPARLDEVLTVVYLLFNEGYLPSTGGLAPARDLTEDAEFLAALLHDLMPTEPEVAGLLALVRLHRARAAARFDEDDEIVQLQRQDRSRWDHAAIEEAGRLIARAASYRRPGPYLLQAAIAACHAESPTWEDTDWTQVVVLYDLLVRVCPSPVAELNRAIALRYVRGPAAALAAVEALGGPLAEYHLWHATRADLLRQLGRRDEAQQADVRALGLTANPAERSLLQGRLDRL